MKCYILEKNEIFKSNETPKKEVSKEIETKIYEIYNSYQARDLHQENSGIYGDVESFTNYEALNQENFVVIDDVVVAYYFDHFHQQQYIVLQNQDKVEVGDYDYSDYKGGSGKVNRGHVALVRKPDIDTNPYHDVPRFHSQEEYDDYIKWKD